MPVVTNPQNEPATIEQPPGSNTDSAETAAPAPASATPPAATTPAPVATRRPRRRWVPVVVLLGMVAAAAVAGALLLGDGDDAAETTTTQATRSVVSAEQRDLIEFTDLDGRMVYADSIAVTGASDGVITDLVAEGATVARGDTLYEVDSTPITVFYGDVALYRELSLGAIGDDVELLEQNLASLGYHTEEDDDGELVDTGFVVDDIFDEATEDAVLRWQEDTGRATTGSMSPSDVVVLDGPAIVTNVTAESGDRASTGTPVLELTGAGSVSTGYVEHTGELELIAAPGAEISSGTVLYTVGEIPITAVVTDAELDRDLEEGVDDGDDIQAIEEMLLALGFDADGELDVDDEWDEATTEAVEDWEDELSDVYGTVAVDGVLERSQYVVLEPGTVVGTSSITDDDVLPMGTELWSLEASTSNRIVETEIAVSEQDQLTEGTTVDIEFPSGEIVQGTVIDVANSSTVDPTDADAEAALAVEILLTSIPESAAALNELDVEVKLVDEIAAGVTVVPVSALVATGDGSFVIEALTSDGGTTFVPVDPGMFNDGFVEVSGIQPGTQVVVPS
ncbi:MAG: peptidoglycan-binding protein [Ilumatobacter sp.]|uniref:peptidoglycan-binding protein n=1 Tax=Ilumatobacter sp. TaxID=1967498 RepID=UPI002638DDCC|nr:peptidoglycan-binding protein [Ilumatobacter sp.]MDJ0768752.1 peptidoglycan-binding protein [Ilumatobacter sp.]